MLRQRAAAPAPEGRRAPDPVPGRVPEAVRVRGRRRGRHVHAGRGVPAGQGVRQDVHVHHHAGHGPGKVEPAARGQWQRADHRHWPAVALLLTAVFISIVIIYIIIDRCYYAVPHGRNLGGGTRRGLAPSILKSAPPNF